MARAGGSVCRCCCWALVLLWAAAGGRAGEASGGAGGGRPEPPRRGGGDDRSHRGCPASVARRSGGVARPGPGCGGGCSSPGVPPGSAPRPWQPRLRPVLPGTRVRGRRAPLATAGPRRPGWLRSLSGCSASASCPAAGPARGCSVPALSKHLLRSQKGRGDLN